MFVDTIPNRKSPPAVLLRESYREGGRVKKRTLANLSRLPQALIDGIDHGLARSHCSPRHTDDQRGGAAARRTPHDPDACPSRRPAGAGLHTAGRGATLCPVADRKSKKERESDQAVMRPPNEKFGLKCIRLSMLFITATSGSISL